MQREAFIIELTAFPHTEFFAPHNFLQVFCCKVMHGNTALRPQFAQRVKETSLAKAIRSVGQSDREHSQLRMPWCWRTNRVSRRPRWGV